VAVVCSGVWVGEGGVRARGLWAVWSLASWCAWGGTGGLSPGVGKLGGGWCGRLDRVWLLWCGVRGVACCLGCVVVGWVWVREWVLWL